MTITGANGLVGYSIEDGGVGAGKELVLWMDRTIFTHTNPQTDKNFFVHINDTVERNASEYIQKVNEHHQNNLFKLSGEEFEVGLFTAAVGIGYYWHGR